MKELIGKTINKIYLKNWENSFIEYRNSSNGYYGGEFLLIKGYKLSEEDTQIMEDF